jgi:hypothetical protein
VHACYRHRRDVLLLNPLDASRQSWALWGGIALAIAAGLAGRLDQRGTTPCGPGGLCVAGGPGRVARKASRGVLSIRTTCGGRLGSRLSKLTDFDSFLVRSSATSAPMPAPALAYFTASPYW